MKNGIQEKARLEAKKSNMERYQIGCVCFKGKRIISYGFNQVRSTSRIPNKYKKFPNSLHAEQHAIMKIRNKEILKGSSILVVRVNRSGEFLMAKPCENCLNTIRFFGIKEIFYSNEDGKIVREKLSEF